MTVCNEEEQYLRDRLRAMFAVGSSVGVGAGCTVVEVRDATHEVVLLVRWQSDPRLYGIPIDLRDTQREFYYTDFPVDSPEEWLDSVGLGMMIRIDTGFQFSARRTLVGDYIELREPGGWPEDTRFYINVVGPDDGDSWLRVPFVAEAGLDPGGAIAARDTGILIGWVTAYENNSTGTPYVGQAIVSRASATTVVLESVELLPGVPVTVAVDMARAAAHVAAATGVLRITTDLDLPELVLVGFLDDADGNRTVDTSFLDEDPDAAAEVWRASLAVPDRWGQDRDAAGRYLPPSRIGRLWHRLRYGPTGSRARVYIG